MKVLYAIQATGNGHFGNAREVIPHLLPHCDLDVLTSGTQAELTLPHPIKYSRHGLGFIFGKKGSVDISATAKTSKPIRFLRDVHRISVNEYDLVLNNFEPITAWACKKIGMPCVGLSHQSAFLSDKPPRPAKRQRWVEWILKYYAPSSDPIGLHFKPYDSFIRTPIIRREIRRAEVSHHDHIAVYLPSVDDSLLVETFSQIRSVRWKVFSKHVVDAYLDGNVEVHPIHNERWVEALASCEGAVIGGGFEGPSEALFLGKKLLIIPMTNQYEQQCNATALEEMGVSVCRSILDSFPDVLRTWLRDARPIKMDYKDETEAIIQNILAT